MRSRPEKWDFKNFKKREIFQTVQSMVFVKKSKFLPCVFIGQIKPDNIVFGYSGYKRMLFGPNKVTFQKSTKNQNFPKGDGPCVSSTTGHLFSLGNIGLENVFYYIPERKNPFLGYRNNKFKKSKNWDFPQGVLVHGFGKKLAMFPSFYFRQYRPGKCLLPYSRTKNAFLDYKNNKFKKPKK